MFDTYQEIFAARATSYQAAMDAVPHARDAEFRCVVDPLPLRPGQRVCDMPAGGGYLRRHLPADVAYLAIEPSPDFVASCPSGPGHAVVQSAIEAVPLDDACVDHAVSLAGLHHSPDLAAALGEMRRLVRPGGRVVIADVAVDTPPAGFLNGYVDRNNPLGHRGTFLDDDTATVAARAGLELLDDRVIPLAWRFNDAQQAGWYCSALFGIREVSELDVARAMADQLGGGLDPAGFTVAWSLRRLICRGA
jgi:SAM-dependent methyltransferase